MRLRQIRSITMALPLLVATAAVAQQPARSAADIITVVGCVQREADYRTQIADGKGGTAGTGLGAGNEFVLRGVRTVSTETLKPTGGPNTRFEDVYSVTGNMESELAKAVGRQVAVSGFVEVDTSAGTSKVKDLPRLNAAGWHVVADRCPAAAAQKR
jgi:hypothetical protein